MKITCILVIVTDLCDIFIRCRRIKGDKYRFLLGMNEIVDHIDRLQNSVVTQVSDDNMLLRKGGKHCRSQKADGDAWETFGIMTDSEGPEE